MTPASIGAVQARDLQSRGEAALLDLRAPADFANGHPSGALNIPFSPRGLGDRARLALPPGRAAILVAPDATSAASAEQQLAAAGVAVRGSIELAAWRAAGLPEATVGLVAVDEVPGLAGRATVVDVREPVEWDTGHVPGALLIPLGELRDRLPSVAKDAPIVTICEAGVRSSVGASILLAAGFTTVSHIPAGSSGYRRSGLPLAFPQGEESA